MKSTHPCTYMKPHVASTHVINSTLNIGLLWVVDKHAPYVILCIAFRRYEARSAKPVIPKIVYMNKDLQEWAEAYGVKIRGPYELDPKDRVSPFPVNSIKSLRGSYILLNRYIHMSTLDI